MQTRFVVQALSPEQATTAVLDRYEAFATLALLPLVVRLESQLALDEIVSNIARNNSGIDGAATIDVRFELDEETLVVDVIDDGVAFNPLAATTIIRSDPLSLPGGFGIALTRRFTEQLTYALEDGKNHLSFRKRVPFIRLRRLLKEASHERQRAAGQ